MKGSIGWVLGHKLSDGDVVKSRKQFRFEHLTCNEWI